MKTSNDAFDFDGLIARLKPLHATCAFNPQLRVGYVYVRTDVLRQITITPADPGDPTYLVDITELDINAVPVSYKFVGESFDVARTVELVFDAYAAEAARAATEDLSWLEDHRD